MHEIWGGVCSRCGREYPGHVDDDDDDDEADDDEDGDGNGGNQRRLRRRTLRQLLLRIVNDIAPVDNEEDDEDGIDEVEMLMANSEEYLDRLEGIEGYRNALFGGGGRGGQFRVASLPPIGEDDMILGRLELTDWEGVRSVEMGTRIGGWWIIGMGIKGGLRFMVLE